MPLMRCPLGAGLWTRDSTEYRDQGTGEVMVAEVHRAEAILAGWTLAGIPSTEQPLPPADAERERGTEPVQAAEPTAPSEPGHPTETSPASLSDRPREAPSPPPHRTRTG
jgi:hypothetical protein